MLASRRGEEEALCAVCAEGHSVDANVIVFCERCDLAVHQLCYGIEHIPSGERLGLRTCDCGTFPSCSPSTHSCSTGYDWKGQLCRVQTSKIKKGELERKVK